MDLETLLATFQDARVWIQALWCIWALRGLWRVVSSYQRARSRERVLRRALRLLSRPGAPITSARLLTQRAADLQLAASVTRRELLFSLVCVQMVFLLAGLFSIIAPDPVRPAMTFLILATTVLFMVAGWFTYRACAILDAADQNATRTIAEYRERIRRISKARQARSAAINRAPDTDTMENEET